MHVNVEELLEDREWVRGIKVSPVEEIASVSQSVSRSLQ